MISTQPYRRLFALTTVFFLVSASLFITTLATHFLHPPPHNQKQSASLLNTYSKLPLTFEANQGQAGSSVRFLAHGRGYTLFLTTTDPVLSFGNQASQSFLRLHLTGANRNPQAVGLDELPGKTNYFMGNDPRLWHTNVPTYARVMYQDVYPGVNLIYYGNQGRLEYDFVIQPGAHPAIIRLDLLGAQHMRIDTQGNLVLSLPGGEIYQPAPFIYQEAGSAKNAISGRYVLLGTNQLGFLVGAYDPTKPLVIDPVLTYSTYLGGNKDDQAYGIAIDSAGNTYVTGYTYSTNFPTKNAFQGTNHGAGDVFVTKLNASGSALVYSTYLGGSGSEVGYSIAVDSAGNAYVTGFTSSTDFPTKNALQPTNHGGYYGDDAFVTKLNASGSALVYSTYLGGSGDDYGQGIAVDSAGNAYLTGYTLSFDFPTKNPLQGKNRALSGGWNAFVTKLNASGSALVYSTYLGGTNYDQGAGIAVDSAGNVYLTGTAGSTDFPTKNPLQGTNHGSPDAFVTKINSTGSALVYSTYLGGNSLDIGQAIALDSSNNVYITGFTSSTNFPTKNAFQGSKHGPENAFVSKINASGSALVYSTYLGGSGHDIGYGIAVDGSGRAYITGYTDSKNFPVVNAIQPTKVAFADVIISEFNASGSALIFSTYLGGSSYDDQGNSIAVDSAGNMYVTGYTQSTKFPTKNPLQATFGGGSYDAFVTKIGP